MGIKYSTSQETLSPGIPDRTDADRYLSDTIEKIKSDVSPEKIKNIFKTAGTTEKSLTTFEGKLKFVVAFLSLAIPEVEEKQRIDQYKKEIEKLQRSGVGQYNADRLLGLLNNIYPVNNTSSTIKGYLGITEKDIFSENSNFLFGLSQKGYSVISYRRFTADFNDTPPNRPKLLERALKQAINSSFLIFGIPRCTMPTCVRAYPNSLDELDQKSLELCTWCKKQLENLKTAASNPTS